VLQAIRSRDPEVARAAAQENFRVFGSRHLRYFEDEENGR
jgi:hypothetical protein